ncbi:uncharacterized protein LMH87_009045 [Akanthomyces muscarius]|uniref:Uncharacterized protein n=1 Tax=Akanthomyces muscarius TaxID=2231603 RepID=A0A9W8QKE6_AKAMU|nr:uncharacterized protein LMH87_009045 [Akanthomyces muscarius]KAJ4158522.1 hypothetical protein LMH87_009045 [Akanthomyces muscarius]
MIAAQLHTVADAANYAATSAYLNSLMGHAGWRTFFGSNFPSIRVPTHLRGIGKWRGLAMKMTTMDRAWERRSFDIYSYGEHPIAPWDGMHYRRHGGRRGQRSIGHATPVDAGLVPGTADEVVACGAGEDLMVKRSGIEGKRPGRWTQHLGRDNGFDPGPGDITAVSVVHRHDQTEVATGRANGQVHLQRLIGSCIATIVQLSLLPQARDSKESRPSCSDRYLWLDDTAISLIEWEPLSNLLATGQDKHLRMYSLSQLPADGDFELEPIEVYDATWNQQPCQNRTFMNTTKFLDSTTVACGIANAHNPLQWGRLTPDGLRLQSTSSDTGGDAGLGRLQTVNAIETVGAKGTLILSAWCDGTIRLTDLRTPEPFDCKYYRRGSSPQDPSSALMTHGQERFVAGSSTSPALHFFDYRSPTKAYHCTDELPSSADSPPPGRNSNNQRDERYAAMLLPPEGTTTVACRPYKDIACGWDAGSRRAAEQTTVRAHSAVFEHVVSLARSCDVADTFYCGLRGGLLETRLFQERWAGDSSDEAAAWAAAAELPRYWPHDLGKHNAWSQKQRPRAMVVLEETTGSAREDYFYVPQSPQSPWRGAHARASTVPVLLDAKGHRVCPPVTAAACWPDDREGRLEPAWTTNGGPTTRLPLTPVASECGDEADEEADCAGEETEVETLRLSSDELLRGPDESDEEDLPLFSFLY